MGNSKSLDLNLYEIRIDSNFINNKSIIETYLYECQCAIFLVDITNDDSFALIKDLLKVINLDIFPYLKIILVQNKLDLDETRLVQSFEIEEFLEDNKFLDRQEISLKNGNNVKDLMKKINTYVNETKNELSCNIVSESIDRIEDTTKLQGYLDFILIGDTTIGKSCFLKDI